MPFVNPAVKEVNRDEVMDEIMKLEEVNLIELCVQSNNQIPESKVVQLVTRTANPNG